jgi:hypothetical protein
MIYDNDMAVNQTMITVHQKPVGFRPGFRPSDAYAVNRRKLSGGPRLYYCVLIVIGGVPASSLVWDVPSSSLSVSFSDRRGTGSYEISSLASE